MPSLLQSFLIFNHYFLFLVDLFFLFFLNPSSLFLIFVGEKMSELRRLWKYDTRRVNPHFYAPSQNL